MQLGRFICLEGIEGTGKTTHLPFIADYLNQTLPKNVMTTREPGGTPIAEAIRKLFLSAQDAKDRMLPETELLLMFAARKQHITQVIQPALEKGRWVICDRFTETSYAYQGAGRGVNLAFIQSLQSFVHQTLAIDRIILFDMEVTDALHRLKTNNLRDGQSLDRIEKESPDFFERARQLYLQRAQITQNNYRVIDASQPLCNVQAQIIQVLDELLKHHSV